MGLVTLALIGGAGYLTVKKINKHKRAKQLQLNGHGQQYNQQSTRSAEDFHGDFNTAQQYYNPSEKPLPTYQDQPNATYTYPNEKGGFQQTVQETKN